jgi:uncharacterized membrane protein HdeD (DUF308 family)
MNGVLTVFLGIAIFAQWPVSGLWVLGTFVGVDLIANGMTWAMAAMTLRNGTGR